MEQKIKERILGAYKVLQSVIEGKDLRKQPLYYQEFITYIYLQICHYAELLDERDDEINRAWAFACVVYQEMKWGLDGEYLNEWIPVEVKLPKKEGWYLTVVPNIKMGYYYMTCKFDGKFPSDVVAWMPIVRYEVKDGK